ncbi:hypothetical protein LJC68_03380 [Bacteroidales bacterium OttesenSCG-928-B11]|nr:hypothetical protein [Bacteroidales bacterium OttesenSCG-928-E04]MDL2311902.1 hypothetical protein [Bacteroidales bacterium OttesenSCG-928-B11]
MTTKEEILNQSHYGLKIYSHILRLYYSDEIVMRLTGRDCGLCRNPFNANKETLHIFIEKENTLKTAMDKEFARHQDREKSIPPGDAFDFAELHYKQKGDLLQNSKHLISTIALFQASSHPETIKHYSNIPDYCALILTIYPN